MAKTEIVLKHIFEILCIPVFFCLFITSLFKITYFYENPASDAHDILSQNPLMSILKLLIFVLILTGIAFFIRLLKIKIPFSLFAILLSMVVMGIGIYWTLTANSTPWADFGICFGIADSINHGDYASFGAGGYSSMFSYQLGLITLERLFLFLFGRDYKVLQFVMVFFTGLFTLSGCFVTRILSNKNKIATGIYAFLVFTFLPIYAYVAAPYGDIPSAALFMFAFWMMLSSLEKFHWYKSVLAGVAVLLSLLFRTNSVIVIIGLILITLFTLKSCKKAGVAFLIAVSAALIIGEVSMPMLYHKQLKDNPGKTPGIVWLNMGLTKESDGWWNNYVYSVMGAAEFDTKQCEKLAKEDFRELTEEYKAEPSQLFRLMYRKTMIQWNDPLIQCLNITAVDPSENSLVKEIYSGKGKHLALLYMDPYMSFVYLLTLLMLIFGLKEKKNAVHYLLLLGVFGGFLFSLVWETKTRYALVYIMFLLPYVSAFHGGFVKYRILDRIFKKKEGNEIS